VIGCRRLHDAIFAVSQSVRGKPPPRVTARSDHA
jgi:hypothetical protein